MARTPNSTTNQNSLGPVGLAIKPDDIVPLKQSGGASISVAWFGTQGIKPTVTVSKQDLWIWNCQENVQKPFQVPLNMRLKEVYWNMFEHAHGSSAIEIGRGTGSAVPTVATVQPATPTELDLLFTVGQNCVFRTADFVRLTYRWQLVARWEIQLPRAAILSSMAPAMPDIESERIQEPCYYQS